MITAQRDFKLMSFVTSKDSNYKCPTLFSLDKLTALCIFQLLQSQTKETKALIKVTKIAHYLEIAIACAASSYRISLFRHMLCTRSNHNIFELHIIVSRELIMIGSPLDPITLNTLKH